MIHEELIHELWRRIPTTLELMHKAGEHYHKKVKEYEENMNTDTLKNVIEARRTIRELQKKVDEVVQEITKEQKEQLNDQKKKD